MLRFFLLITCISWISYCSGQRPPGGGWLSINVPVQVSSKWQWHNDAGYRTLGPGIEPLQFFLRTGLRYKIDEVLTTAGGVAFFFTRTKFNKEERAFGKEFRIWQEVNTEKVFAKKIKWLSRLRTEQRFFEQTAVKKPYTAFRFRIRAMLLQHINPKLSLQLSEEYMNQYVKRRFGFDQNRVALSLVYKLNQSIQLQPGYMLLKWPDSLQHIVMVTVQKRFLFNKTD